MGKREPLYTVGGNVNWYSHYGKHMEVPQKTKNRVAIWSSNPTPGIYPDKTLIQKDTCTSMFIAALFTVTKTWKQPKCPSTESWFKRMWGIFHTQ